MSKLTLAEELATAANFSILLQEEMTPAEKEKFKKRVRVNEQVLTIYNDFATYQIIDVLATLGRKEYIEVITLLDYNEEDVLLFQDTYKECSLRDGFAVESSASKENDYLWLVKLKLSW